MYSTFCNTWLRVSVFVLLTAALFVWIPAAKSDSYADAFPTIPEKNWIGLRLIILPQSKALQHFGYQELYQDSDAEYAPLRYEDYVGRVVRVVGIGQGNGPNGSKLDVADLRFEDNKETIHGDIDHGCMDDVAPFSDLEAAQKRYLGKTLWLASDHITTYDPEKDVSDTSASAAESAAFRRIRIKQFMPVRVLEIVAGWYASAPTRFIVQAKSGTETTVGYVDVHMSDTNVPQRLQSTGRFEDTFLESDPRKEYSWPLRVWEALENRKIFLGMAAQQVRMSWGRPTEIDSVTSQSNTEQWIYDSHHVLTLKDGIVKKIVSL